MNQQFGWKTPTQAAAAFPGIGAATWRRWAKEGRVPTIRVGQKFLIDVDEALEAVTVKPKKATGEREAV